MSEKLELFLGGFPESTHPFDKRRFVEYAIECAELSNCIDVNAMQAAGLSQETIDRYETAYSWVRETLDVLVSQGRL